MDHFEAAFQLLFRQRELFNILVSERRLIHREIHNKVNCVRGFDTGDLVVGRKQMNASRKDRVAQKLVFKTKGP